MDEKKYPIHEEEGNVGRASEPIAEYKATGSGYEEAVVDDDPVMSDDYDPGIGPYTMEELNARIDEAEVFIEKAEKGDWSDWVTEEQSRANLYSKYPWLQ
jgi:hypothetical protein